MNSLDLSALPPSRAAHLTEVLSGAELTVSGGSLSVTKPTELSAGLIDAADLRDIARAACHGLPDGVYGVGVGDVVRPTPEVNPFAAGTFNLTDIISLRRASPDLAERCQRAASGEVNPWARGQVNLTEQMRIARTDPSRAARLRSAAGR